MMLIKYFLTTVFIISSFSLFASMGSHVDLKVYSSFSFSKVEKKSENQQINQQDESSNSPLNPSPASNATIENNSSPASNATIENNSSPASNATIENNSSPALNIDNLSYNYQKGMPYTGRSSYNSSHMFQPNESNTGNTDNEKTNKIPTNLAIPSNWGSPGIPSYEPEKTSIKKGEKLSVKNKDINDHTVTSNNDEPKEIGKLFDSGLISSQDIKIVDTSKLEPGEYPFTCILHPSMEGTLIVS
jgi:plastocyanin